MKQKNKSKGLQMLNIKVSKLITKQLHMLIVLLALKNQLCAIIGEEPLVESKIDKDEMLEHVSEKMYEAFMSKGTLQNALNNIAKFLNEDIYGMALVSLIKENSDQYMETASFQVLKGRCWTPPSLSNGRLYLRNREEMVCLNLTKQESGGK